MARGVALSVLRALFKAETHSSQDTISATDTEINYLLATTQATLCARYDWPFMADRWERSCTAGTRYFSLPTSNVRSISATINFERPVRVHVKWNGNFWYPVKTGISVEEYNAWDSDDGEAADPIQRWSLDTNTGDSSNADEFEVWPIPVTTQTIRFEGQRAPRALASDSDKADLDDRLIILLAAAEWLTNAGSEKAPLAQSKAANHLTSIRSSYPSEQGCYIIGGNTHRPEKVKLIAVG